MEDGEIKVTPQCNNCFTEPQKKPGNLSRPGDALKENSVWEFPYQSRPRRLLQDEGREVDQRALGSVAGACPEGPSDEVCALWIL